MKKESLQTTTVKTLLAVLLFAGMGIIILGGGCIIWEYSRNATNHQIVKPVDEEGNYYDILEEKCAGDSCCLASLKIMRENNYKEADENGKCSDGFNGNTMRSVTSYKWCEPMEEIESEIIDFKVEKHQTFSYDGASMAMDCKFLYGEVRSGKFESKKLLVYFPDYTTYPNYLRIDEYIEKDATIKVFLTNNKSILRNKFDEIYGENYGGEFPYYCLEDEDMDNNKKNDYASQEIFALKMPDKESQLDTSDWQTYRNEEFGFEVKYPKYYYESTYDFDSMMEEDYDRIHFFRNMGEEESNDFKKHYTISLEEGGTHSGTILIKSYNDEEELKKWYEIESFKNFEIKEFENVNYYVVDKLTKYASHKNKQFIVGYNYIIPHRKIDSLFLVFEIPEFLKLKFENDFLSSFKFIDQENENTAKCISTNCVVEKCIDAEGIECISEDEGDYTLTIESKAKELQLKYPDFNCSFSCSKMYSNYCRFFCIKK